MNIIHPRLPLFIALLLSLTLTSCRKDREAFNLAVTGTIADVSSHSGLAGVVVILKSQEITNGTWSGTFKEIAQTQTNSDGTYKLEFKQANVVDYEITFAKDLYYQESENINPDHVVPEEAHVFDYELKPKAWLSVRAVNVNAFDEDDNITYNLGKTYDCPGCCTGSSKSYTGVAVDETHICPIIGNAVVNMTWATTKNRNVGSGAATFSCIPFDTTYYTIQY